MRKFPCPIVPSKGGACLAFGLMLAVLAGCAVPPRTELNPAETRDALERRSLRDPGLARALSAQGLAPEGDWDLPRLTLAAFHFQPGLAVARARLAEAEAAARTAAELPNPTFTFTPGRKVDVPTGVSPWILGYALSFPAELAGIRAYRSAEARERSEAARLALAAAAWETHARVRRALIGLQAAQEQLELRRRQEPLLRRIAALVEAKVAAGEAARADSAEARKNASRSEFDLREDERALASARSRVAEAIGVPLAALEGVTLSFRGLADHTRAVEVAEARRWAAVNRADLLTALAEYAASQSALQAEVVRLRSGVSIGPGYELDQGSGKWSLALGVTLPVFHRNEGPVAVATARREAAAARFIELQARVLAEVERAGADYAATLASLKAAQALRMEAERQARAVTGRLAAGSASRLEEVTALAAALDDARVELTANIRALEARGFLEDAVQRPLAVPESAWRDASSAGTSNR